MASLSHYIQSRTTRNQNAEEFKELLGKKKDECHNIDSPWNFMAEISISWEWDKHPLKHTLFHLMGTEILQNCI